MSSALTIIAAIGGVLTIIGSAVGVVRIIANEGRRRQRFDDLEKRVASLPCADHDRRISVLEGRGPRRR